MAVTAKIFFILLAVIASSQNSFANSKKLNSSYLIVTPRVYRAGVSETITITLFNVRKRSGVTCKVLVGKKLIASATKIVYPEDSGKQLQVLLKIPDNTPTTNWRREGKFEVLGTGGVNFHKNKQITIQKKNIKIFIQTDKPIYKPGEKVRFRVIAIKPDLKPVSGKINKITITSPTGSRMRQWDDTPLEEGFLSLDMNLSKKPVLGVWKIKAKYKGVETVQNIKVIKYVLPKYEITVDAPAYLLKKTATFSVRVCAKYTYGKPVKGKISTSICYDYKKRYSWRKSYDIPRICMVISKNIEGCADFDINFPILKTMTHTWNRVVSIDSSVTESATGITLNTTKNITRFENLDIKISLDGSANVFKPGFPTVGKLHVTTQDGKPAMNKQVKVTIKWTNKNNNQKPLKEMTAVVPSGLLTFNIDPPEDAVSIRIRAEYVSERQGLKHYEKRSMAYLTIKGWYSPSNSYMNIEHPKKELKVGDKTRISVTFTPKGKSIDGNRIYFNLLCRGNTELSHFVESPKGGWTGKLATAEILFTVTQRMVPKCRLFVYFVRKDRELVGDTVEINIEKKFQNDVRVTFADGEKKPSEKVVIQLTATPGSRFALSAVDKSVQLLGGSNDLKADKVLGIIDNLDVGPGWSRSRPKCGHPVPWWRRDGWGRRKRRSIMPYRISNNVDAAKAINDAGLIYISDLKIDTKPCPRRYATFLRTGIPVPVLERRPVAMRGRVSNTMSKSADKRPQPPPASKKPKKAKKHDVTVRTEFPETWLWMEDKIDPKTGKKTIEAKVPDTLTTWYANAFAVSSNTGIGVSSPASLRVFQPFFVSLTVPYSVIRGETLVIPATVFNYLDSCLTIRVSMETTDEFIAKSRTSTKLCVCGNEAKTIKFSIKPKKLGRIPVTVKAVSVSTNVCAKNLKMAKQIGAADAVRRKILVEAEGIKKEHIYSTLFCAKEPKAFHQTIPLQLPAPVVPDSTYATVSIYGDLMGPTLTDLDKLLAMPYGCGEQNMLKFAPNIYVLDYLTNTRQLTKVAEDKAKEYMRSGYQRELTYKRKDGSYAAFGEREKEGSTWLSAFVLHSFAEARPYILIDQKDIRDTVKFLFKLQKKDGCFKEIGMVHNKAMKGGVTSGITMTAFVVNALLAAKIDRNDIRILKALDCIKGGLTKVNDAYSVAILAHTLTLAGDPFRVKMIEKLKSFAIKGDGLTHWEQKDKPTKPQPYYYHTRPADVEMTAYALMAYIGNLKDAVSAAPIVRWISRQRNSLGGFASTQDTCVALQALSKYGSAMYSGAMDLVVSVATPEITHSVTINDKNKLVLQRVEIPKVPSNVNVTAIGRGCGLLQASIKYNVPKPQEEPAFILDVSKELSNLGQLTCKHDMTICARYTKGGSSNMALIDVKMVSGFEPVTDEIDKILQSTTNDVLREYEFVKDILTLYFDKIGTTKTCITFPVEQKIEVKDRKPAHVKVYDYYDTIYTATKMYSIDKCPK